MTNAAHSPLNTATAAEAGRDAARTAIITGERPEWRLQDFGAYCYLGRLGIDPTPAAAHAFTTEYERLYLTLR